MITNLRIIPLVHKNDEHKFEQGVYVEFSDQKPAVVLPVDTDDVACCIRLNDNEIIGCTTVPSKIFIYDCYGCSIRDIQKLEWYVSANYIYKINEELIAVRNHHGIMEIWQVNPLIKKYEFGGAWLDSNGFGYLNGYQPDDHSQYKWTQLKLGKELISIENTIIGNIDDYEMSGHSKGPVTTGTYKIDLEAGTVERNTYFETNVSFDSYSALGSGLGKFSPNGSYALQANKTSLQYSQDNGGTFTIYIDLIAIKESPKIIKQLPVMSFTAEEIGAEYNPSRIKYLKEIAIDHCENGRSSFLQAKSAQAPDKETEERIRNLSRLHGFIKQVLWEVDEKAFWITSYSDQTIHRQTKIRRISIDGTMSLPIVFYRWSNQLPKISWGNDGSLKIGFPDKGHTQLLKKEDAVGWVFPKSPVMEEYDNFVKKVNFRKMIKANKN